MLVRLTVSNLAVVADATLEFGPALNVVTGETGAGKSLIIGAVGLLAGDRAAGTLVRTGCESARVEAVFEPRDVAGTDARLDALGLPPLEEGCLLVRREIGSDGRSRAFVGDTQVRVATLRTLGEHLVDVHGQAEGHELLKPSRQRAALDEAAGTGELLGRLGSLLTEERRIGAAIVDGLERSRAIARDRELFEHQLREIDDASLDGAEADALREERRRYLASERIVEDAGALAEELVEAENAAIDRLARAAARLERLAAVDRRFAAAAELVDAARISAEEAGRTVADLRAGLDFSESRRDEVEQRLELISHLERKYARSVPEILAYADSIRDALDDDEESARERERLESARARVRSEAGRLADRLSAERVKAARTLAREVSAELPELGMEDGRFQVHLEAEHDPDGWYERDGVPVRIGANGGDRVEFRLAANRGQAPGSLARMASGGELSRVVLALEARLAAAMTCDVMIFDEIDAGVGGRTARAVAERMAALASDRQVIAITHLAPVACVATLHHRIEKTSSRDATRVSVRRLEGEDRIGEIARMLSGGEEDPAARAHARELLDAMRPKLDRRRSRHGRRARSAG